VPVPSVPFGTQGQPTSVSLVRYTQLAKKCMINIKQFLEKFFNKQKLKSLATRLDIDTKLDTDSLIKTISSTDMYGIELMLLKDFDKSNLQSISKKIGLKISGSIDELENRIFNLIDFGERFPKGYHFVELDQGSKLKRIKIDKEYLLYTYFSKESLKDLASEYNLKISGNRDDIIERLVLEKNILLKNILNVLNKEQLLSICHDLDIDSKFFKESTIENIIQKIKEIEKSFSSAKNLNLVDEMILENQKEFIESNANHPITFSDLSLIYDFLDKYKIKSYEINSKLIEPEISNALSREYGHRNVKTQVSVTGGKIDIECKNIGIEIKTPTSRNDLRSMVAQLIDYKKTYNSNLIVLVVNAGARPTDIYTYTDQCKKLGINVIIKD
jgi:hypothetical protein